MPYFQNPFGADFYGVWVLGDRQYSVDFKVPRNAGRGDEYVTVWEKGPYALNGNDDEGNPKNVLHIMYSMNDPKNWSALNVTISASSLSAVTPQELVSSLTSSSIFNDNFTAVSQLFEDGSYRVSIRQKHPITRFRFYVTNIGAETVLHFNKLAGVAEMPTFFKRHTIENRFNYPDSQGIVIELDPDDAVDAAVIENAVDEKGHSLNHSGTPLEDWELLRGRSGIFTFKKNTVSDDLITTTIEYPAGAKVGDMARKIDYTYTGGSTAPEKVTEIPYTLTEDDLVTVEDGSAS